MKKIYIAAILLCAGSMLLLGGTVASAATPTPTLRPIPPSATLNSLYSGPTPTLLPVIDQSVDLTFDSFNAKPAADTAINIYRFFNRDHLIDLVMGGAVAVFTVALMTRYITKKTENDE